MTKEKKMDRYYEDGFCKTAEAYGVDPAELYKQALVPPNLRNFGSIFKRSDWARSLGL